MVRSLEAALWAFENSRSFQEGCLLAANLGNDAETTAAVYGQLTGGHYGIEGLPPSWRPTIALRETIEFLAEAMFRLSGG